MKKKNTFYITTPIYYVNAKPHIGHIYTTIASDVLARYHRLIGDETMFLTGVDENSQKNVEAAEEAGKGDDVQGYLDEMAAVWEKTFDTMGFTNDDFIRTTSDRHKENVKKFFMRVWEKGDIYEGEYEGLYCVGCEAFVTENDLVDEVCPHHKKRPKIIKEKNYFFKLKSYKEKLLKHINEHPEFIRPQKRRNEIVSYIENFMDDISISRQSVKWGIPVPTDEEQSLYVWFDALINYLSGVNFHEEGEMYNKFWPANVQLMAKDIIKFHCALWPAMLMSAELPLPKSVFAHGFFTINGEKISKSLGNAIDPIELAEKYGNDTIRYFFLREIHFGEDGDFSFTRLVERNNSDLANEFGNLVNRVISMTEKYFDNKVPDRADNFTKSPWTDYQKAMEDVSFHGALEIVWKLIRESNKYIEEKQPWTLAKEDKTEELGKVMYSLLENLRLISIMVWPFMPVSTENLLGQLGLDHNEVSGKSIDELTSWGVLEPGTELKKGDPLFPRLEV